MSISHLEEQLFDRTLREHEPGHEHRGLRPQYRLIPDPPVEESPTDIWWILDISLEDVTAHATRWHSSQYHVRIPCENFREQVASHGSTIRIFIRDDDCHTEINCVVTDEEGIVLADARIETATRYPATLNTALAFVQSAWLNFTYCRANLYSTSHARGEAPEVHRPKATTL